MGLKLWSKGKREITPEVGAVLLKEFEVDRQTIANLRFVDKQGKYAGRSVRQICIFDPEAAPHTENSSSTYDEVMSHQMGVLFVGYIEKDGFIYLARKEAA